MTSLRFRAAGPDDAEQVALLHADSWRRHYRGAYADSFLDGDVVADRRSVWSSRLLAPVNATTVVTETAPGWWALCTSSSTPMNDGQPHRQPARLP